MLYYILFRKRANYDMTPSIYTSSVLNTDIVLVYCHANVHVFALQYLGFQSLFLLF